MKKLLHFTAVILLAGSAFAEDKKEAKKSEKTEKAEAKNKAKNKKEEILTKSKEYTEKDAIDIVTKAEKIRAVENAEIDVSLKTKGGRKKSSDYLMFVQRGENKRALVNFLEPPEDNGRRLLIVKDRYWSKFPDSRKIHAVSRREMLGNSVFGIVDLFQLDVHEEYKARIVGETVMEGKKCYKAILDARHEKAVYKKIDYYIAMEDHFPVKALFYAESGRLLKTLLLTSRRKLAGKVRPDGFTMFDNIAVGRKSKWKTLKLRRRDIPDHVFRRTYLRKKN